MPMPSKPRPAGFAAYARQFGRKASRLHFHIAHTTYDRWCAEVGITMRQVQADMPMPHGFAGHASVSSNDELRARYNVGKAAIIRWRKECGVPGKRNGDTKKPLPETFAATARGLSRPQLCQRYGVCDSVIRRWQKEAGVTPFSPKLRPLKSWGQTAPLKTVDNRPDSLVTRAQSHLQRIGPVWKRGDGFYVFGRQMTVDQMLSRAEAMGFDPNEWKRVANADRV